MILAVDTATKWTGLALHDGRSIVTEVGWHSVNQQTVELAPAVSDLLERAGMSPSELAAIAVAIGPGSYTGLRIGLAFAKGLALANKTRLIGIPTLDILAAALPQADGVLVAIAQAGRSRVWAGTYHWQRGKGWQSQEKPVIDDWRTLLGSVSEPATFSGEITPGAAKMIRASEKKFWLTSSARSVRRAGYLAELGWLRLRRGWIDESDSLTPAYLRDPAGAITDVD
jgi:tRNA threonylcarbamoyladenosine biosynthesis protein TsaB